MAATPPTPRDRSRASAKTSSAVPVETFEGPRRRLLALGLVLFVSFGHFIASSVYYSMGGTVPTNPRQQAARLLAALIAEAGSLALLWYVLSGQGRTWKNIGWNLEWMDLLRAGGLVLGSVVGGYVMWYLVQVAYYSYFGHYLTPNSTGGLLWFGISGLSVAFVCLNPFFEELIVRGYLMSEILDLGGKGVWAILISIAVQMSYHLYQGFANGIMLTAGFAVLSIYFWRTRRIAPVVLAHLFMDAYAMVRRSF
jgi:membrane protease YdiL (CAAX protease family)